MWLRLEKTDFKPKTSLVGSALGTMSASKVARLRVVVDRMRGVVKTYMSIHPGQAELYWLSQTLQIALDRLSYPATFRDMLRQHANLFRMYLMTRAWLIWHTELFIPRTEEATVREDLMGAFTTQPTVVQHLFMVGCPVWAFRDPGSFEPDDVVLRFVDFTLPDGIRMGSGEFSGGSIYTGSAGHGHLITINARAFDYIDLEKTPYPRNLSSNSARQLPSAVPQKSGQLLQGKTCHICTNMPPSDRHNIGRAQPKKLPGAATRAGRSKFDDFKHKWMPPPIQAWIDALRAVDVRACDVAPGHVWPYWLPEPALIIGSSSPERVERAIKNWLRIREPWLAVLRDRDDEKDRSSSAAGWRVFLNDGPLAQADRARARASLEETGSMSKRQATNHYFIESFARRFEIVNVQKDSVPRWFGQEVEELLDSTCLPVIWELHELSFRAELIELDRRFVPWKPQEYPSRLPRDTIIARVTGTYDPFTTILPPATGQGLAAARLADRADALQALRKLMEAWPNPPDVFKLTGVLTERSPDDHLIVMERIIAAFYVKSFYSVAGRAPVLPRLPPVL